MFAEYAAQVEFRHDSAARARDQHVRELIADHLMPAPHARPERLRAHAAALRASTRRRLTAWPRPIGLHSAGLNGALTAQPTAC